MSIEHEELICGPDLGADFGIHGETRTARGWNMLVISDVKSGLPVWAKLVAARGPEFVHLFGILDELYAEAPWIADASEVLIGDGAFGYSRQQLFDLETRYGLHAVMPRPKEISAQWMETDGVPSCARHGLMKLDKRDKWKDHRDPAHELHYSQPWIDDYAERQKLCHARTRYKCTQCAAKAAVWFKAEPRLYGYYLYVGAHDDVAMRRALQRKRNVAEMINARLQFYGVGGTRQDRAKWAKTHRQMAWLVYMTLLGMTVKREAWESGRYAAEVDTARVKRLVMGTIRPPADLPPAPPTHGPDPAA